MTAETPPHKRLFFVVGASRSGTTMLGRILGLNEKVHFFKELHFFEELWVPSLPPQPVPRQVANNMIRRLMHIQREGYLKAKGGTAYVDESRALVDRLGDGPLLPNEAYRHFIDYEVERAGRTAGVEQTPAYALYAREILALYPDVHIVHIVRDPRDVLASQRMKWRRRALDKAGSGFTRLEMLRSWANYHAWTTAKLWRAAVRSMLSLDQHPRVLTVRFEDLTRDPKQSVQRICAFLSIPYSDSMLLVPKRGSSRAADDPSAVGVDVQRSKSRWREELPAADQEIAEMVCGAEMDAFGYPRRQQRNSIAAVGAMATMPAKLILATALNLSRTKNLIRSARRRLVR